MVANDELEDDSGQVVLRRPVYNAAVKLEKSLATAQQVGKKADDLLTATSLGRTFDLICTAERAKGYKPDGTLFRYLIARAGCSRDDILHSGQSQFTDMVGGKPLDLTIVWINRRDVALHPSVPKPDFVFPDVASLLDLLEV